MKPKTMVLMVIAVACGLGASYMTSKLLAERNQPKQEETVMILVAKKRIPKYTKLTKPEEYFELKPRLVSAAPEFYFSEFDKIKDKKLNREFKKDEHITPDDFKEVFTSGLDIPPKHVGVAVAINAEKAVGFFVFPGSRVDIIWTRKTPKVKSQTLLRNVKVVSVADKTVRPDSGDSSVVQAQTVTVALLPEDAQKVRLAQQNGELSFALRRSDEENDDSRVREITLADLDRSQRSGGTDVKDGEEGDGKPIPETPVPVIKNPEGVAKTDPGTKKEPDGVAKTEPEKKDDPAVEDAPKPVWTVKVISGADAPRLVHFYEKDGEVTPDLSNTPEKPEKSTPTKGGPKTPASPKKG